MLVVYGLGAYLFNTSDGTMSSSEQLKVWRMAFRTYSVMCWPWISLQLLLRQGTRLDRQFLA